MTLGEILKARRKELGLTQKELAGRMGVSFQMVSRWEQTATFDNTQLSSLLRLCNALNLNPQTFIIAPNVVSVISQGLFWSENIDIMIEHFFDSNGYYNNILENARQQKQYTIPHNHGISWELSMNTSLFDEVVCHNMFVCMLKNDSILKDKVCIGLKEVTINNIELMLSASDISAQSEYLVELIRENCQILSDNSICPKNALTNVSLLKCVSGVPYALEGSKDSIKSDMIKYYSSLNEKGQKKALEQIEMLSKIPEYQADNTSDIDKTDVSDDNNK
jgi:transcriptional regulator with XRE-family HTH domain